MRKPVRFLVRQCNSSQSCVLFRECSLWQNNRQKIVASSFTILKPYDCCLWDILKDKMHRDNPRNEDGMKGSNQDVGSSHFHYQNLDVQ